MARSSKRSHLTIGMMIEKEVIMHEGTMILTMGKCKIIYSVRISAKYHLKLPAKMILTKTHDQKTT